ncbi:HEAT repeat domain-containing protein [Streptomyces sp. Tue6028]|uniref:HEAT repeat domain-containing protein n=1 Tax=Streptomyces sp. Tue6028 TaxID=2036037 RepID=UPI003D729B40
MFTGIEEVDWASMGHAYTDSATDVPDLLWGLASDDPARRDIALDGMYGAVHHQGDVYDSTVACIPFLFELVGTPTVADRDAVVRLLRSIAGEKEPDPEELGGIFEDEEEDAAWIQPFLDASRLIRGRADLFLGLLDDPDAELRAALPGALAHLHAEPTKVFSVLRDRLPVETDTEAAHGLARAIGTLAVDHAETLGSQAGPVLRDVLDRTADPQLRMTVLAQLARCAPDLLPDNTAEAALEIMRLACEARHGESEEEPEPAPERPSTPTMVSYLRDLEAAHRKSVDADRADDLLEELHRALGDRVDVRFDLLNGQLCSQDWGQRVAAVRMSGLLLTGWRAANDLPVALLARQLVEEEPDLSERALNELSYVAPIAHVVAEILAVCVREWDDEWEPDGWERTLYGRALAALALQGDERAVPALVDVMAEGGDTPEYLARWVKAIGAEAAAPLGPVLHRRLTALAPGAHRDRSRLIDALGVIAPAPSLELLISMLGDEQGRQARWSAAQALTRYGRAAAQAAPRLRESVTDEATPTEIRLDAAEALWAVTGEADLVLPVVRDGLDSTHWYGRSAALRIIGALGPAGAALAPRLRELAVTGTDVPAAVALWKVTGDVEAVLPVLLDEWTATPRSRPAAAACLAGMGRAAAPALPLIRAELASPRRHNNDGTTGNVRYDVAEDEALLSDCRTIEAAFTALDG